MPETAGAGSNELPLSLVLVGGSGDLVRKKIVPALFAIFCQGLLPPRTAIFGFARRPMSDEAYREHLQEHLTCRYAPGASCAREMTEFLSRCHYVQGDYASRDAFLGLYERLREFEGSGAANRLFYMAIPPFLFDDVGTALGAAGLVNCDGGPGWSRVVVEKPFGRDRASSDALVTDLGRIFSESQTYRIDHYLGKEIVQNLLVLRFANRVFEPIWNRAHVESVRILWKEDIGVESRAGYFDQYGIIRDVMQNHLLQILALVAMEPPGSLSARHVRDEKVRVLDAIAPVGLENLVLGQYRAGDLGGAHHAGYLEEADIPADSITPTFAAAALYIDNERWRGVPFLIRAGKGLGERLTEIRLRFRRPARNLFAGTLEPLPADDLVIRVQPDEAILLNVVNKVPGLDLQLVESPLDLKYASAFSAPIPEAYECLLLDVIRGDKSLFIRQDELARAWDVFTPALEAIERDRVAPHPYSFGSDGPDETAELARKHGFEK